MVPLLYVINLDRDVERMASIRANLDTLGLPFERISAVMAKDVPDWESLVDLPTYAWRNRLDRPRAGEVGCYLSHLKAMETFLRTDAPWCVILEDDVEVLPACAAVLRALAEQDDWDKARRTVGKAMKLFLARAKKEICRFGYSLVQAVR